MNKFSKLIKIGMLATVVMTVAASAESNYSRAKKACLAENPNLKGRELQKCIKEKKKKQR